MGQYIGSTYVSDDADVYDNRYERLYESMKFYSEYLANQMEMDQYINESIILASGNRRAIQEMVLLEAGAGEKIKSFFEKIINFFKAVFAKMGERLTGWSGDVKKYIDNPKYNKIIYEKKYIAGDMDMVNHLVGFGRIQTLLTDSEMGKMIDTATTTLNGKLNKFSQATDLKALQDIVGKEVQDVNKLAEGLLDADATILKDFKKLTNDNGEVDINVSFRAYLNGSEDKITFGQDDDIEKNMSYFIGVLYNCQGMVQNVKKIEAAISKKLSAVQNNCDKKLTEIKGRFDKITNMSKEDREKSNTDAKQAIEDEKKNNPQVGKSDSGGEGTGDGGTISKGVTVNPEAYSYGNHYKYFTEDDTSSKTSDNTSNHKSSQDVTAQKQGINNNLKNVNQSNTTVGDKTDTNKQIMDVNGNADEIKKALNDVQSYILNYATAFSNYLNGFAVSMTKAFELTMTDYFAIIRNHVKYYLSHPEQMSNTENDCPKRSPMLQANGQIINPDKADVSGSNGHANDVQSKGVIATAITPQEVAEIESIDANEQDSAKLSKVKTFFDGIATKKKSVPQSLWDKVTGLYDKFKKSKNTDIQTAAKNAADNVKIDSESTTQDNSQ